MALAWLCLALAQHFPSQGQSQQQARPGQSQWLKPGLERKIFAQQFLRLWGPDELYCASAHYLNNLGPEIVGFTGHKSLRGCQVKPWLDWPGLAWKISSQKPGPGHGLAWLASGLKLGPAKHYALVLAKSTTHPSSSISMATALPRQVVVDDTDPAIQYGAQGWFVADPSRLQAGNFGPIYNGTSTTASTDSSFSFAFNGTSILVQGSIIVSTDANNVTDPTWSCTVDGIEINNPNPTFPFPENNWALCEQDTMTLSPHNLTVQIKSKGQPFYFDSLIYTPPPDAFIQSAVLLYSDVDPALSYTTVCVRHGSRVGSVDN
ncbi:hypothetical protein DFH09DRAFT_1275671 [Mycena vulgaris]|nr:hypothetical protein DFH09DRAFT_1275671 [Mycena vulgaris]